MRHSAVPLFRAARVPAANFSEFLFARRFVVSRKSWNTRTAGAREHLRCRDCDNPATFANPSHISVIHFPRMTAAFAG